MPNRQFSNISKAKAQKITSYVVNQAPGMVIRKTLRFIDGNFRAQGWQGNGFKPWAPIRRRGTILVKTGALRRSWNYTGAGAGTVRFYSNLPYADAHNRGFEGTVSVKAHTRARYTKSRVTSTTEFTRNGRHRQRTITTKTGESNVRAHTRKVKIIQRQFAPYEGHESQTLNKSIQRELEREIKAILN